MRVLLLHGRDSQHAGPWTAQSWDLVVNLGRARLASEGSAQRGTRILHLDSYFRGLDDNRIVRGLLRAGCGQLIDGEGLDWWELTSVGIVQPALEAVLLERVAAEIPNSAELWSTRPDWPANAVAMLLKLPLRTFQRGKWKRAASGAMHYASMLHRFSPAQIRQIFLDKYDAGYRWRSLTARLPDRCTQPVVLVPSAYANVSRMAAQYAAMLPRQQFLFVATRLSAHEFSATANAQVRNLSSYAKASVQASEFSSLMQSWARLKSDLYSSATLRLLCQTGVVDRIQGFFQSGLFVREAWRQVLDREPVAGVLCGDDSNFCTRLPVLLAAQRNIPTVDFHHGALDGLYLFKNLPCDLFMAKSEMEMDYLVGTCGLPSDKIVFSPPVSRPRSSSVTDPGGTRRSIVLFSEPYEIGGMRAEDIYGELLPRLWRLASGHDCDLVVKLHPFESRSDRSRVIQRVLPKESAGRVRLVVGPPKAELFQSAWFGITIESTTAIDCAQNGVCCFLCRWLRLSPYGYAEQFTRFGMGASLESPDQISEIPRRLEESHNRAASPEPLEGADPAQLQQWLTSGSREVSHARSAS